MRYAIGCALLGLLFWGAGNLSNAPSVAISTRHAASPDDYPAVTSARLSGAANDDGWLMYRRSYDSRGFAPFSAITASNVRTLQTAFTYDTGFPQGHEAPPIVNGRTMFITTPLDNVIALDATTGRRLWIFKPSLDVRALRAICCDVVNRGVGLYGDLVYVGTIDNRLIALDARSGRVVWQRTVVPLSGDHAITGAPLVADGRIITGAAGGEFGARGLIAAFDARTGAPLWRRWTVPSPREPGGDTWLPGSYLRGGGDTWVTGSYDPQTRTLFWGTGNPSPWFGGLRPGKNLYTDSLIALDVATGNIKWYYQYTPHDSWDYDGVNELVLVELERGGKRVPAIVHADRNGYFFALDRRNGKFLYARAFVKTNTILRYTAAGNAVLNPAAYPSIGKTVLTCPSSAGGKNWYPIAYSPQTSLAYVPTLHLCADVTGTGNVHERFGYYGEISRTIAEPGAKGFGELNALDARTGRKAWSIPSAYPWTGGVVATGGGLVFSGNASGAFCAFDARNGTMLWKTTLSSGVVGVPVTYRVDGKQYVAVYAGYGGGLAMFGGPAAALTEHIPRGGRLYVFALPAAAEAH
jgi:alcohol dehydrogenase (cytochrome c)